MTEGLTLLDGAIGHLLQERVGGALWSVDAMQRDPDALRDLHLAYFRAGAEIATINTYALSHDRLARFGHADAFAALHLTAVTAARRARDIHGAGLIAGSIGPPRGSYKTAAPRDLDDIRDGFRERASILAPLCDLILLETLPSLTHVRAAVEATEDVRCPVWIALTVDDEDGRMLRSGEPLAEALPLLHPASAVLINCSAPRAIPVALDALSPLPVRRGAYANAFGQTTKDFLSRGPDTDARPMEPAAFADAAAKWADAGATIIGGCCATTPEHVAALANRFTDRA